jgi:dTDP-4-amino-4,6-dideoxygalactose transaminase
VASASAIVMRGAKPVFADIDLDTQNITAESIKAVLTPQTKAIICVHLAGWPCQMDKIMALAKQHNLKVIEDCAQAHGAVYKGKKVGSFGDMAAFSFCQDKIMTAAGEGGMLLTNDEALWKKAWAYKDHGKSYDAVFNKTHPPGFRWLHEDFGTNWRLSEVQSAVGRKQLAKLPGWLKIRRNYADMLNQALVKLPIVRVPKVPEDIQHACYKYYVFIETDKLKSGWTRDKIIQDVNSAGIKCFSGSCSEIYLEKCFEKHNLQPSVRLTNAKALGETSLMILIHPTLSQDKIEKAIKVLSEILIKATHIA